MSISIALSSGFGSAANFFALTWKWSPWMKTGPACPSRIAAPSMTAAYSAGRWSV